MNLQKLDSATIQRAAAGLSSSMFNALQQVAGQTPFGASGYGQFQVLIISTHEEYHEK